MWRAIRTRSRHEFCASRALKASGITEFLPCFTGVSRWHDRRKTIERPLFTGYLFGFFGPDEYAQVRRASGVAQVIDEPIDYRLVHALMTVMRDPAAVLPAEYPQFERGERVTIARGALAGLSGVVDRIEGALRLIIRVDIIGRACAVTLGANDVIGRGMTA